MVADPEPFEAIVIGTGFGGAVTACRLVEAGIQTCVLERGRRYGPNDFPRYPIDELLAADDGRRQAGPPPDFSRWLWIRDQGLYEVRNLGDVTSVQAAGYGGGSLIYVNVHMRPPYEVFDDRWPVEYRNDSLRPYFDLAAYMLQVAPIPNRLPKTLQLHRAATQIHNGSEEAWFRTPLAVRFGAGQPSDEEQSNPFNRPQRECDMRGRCFRGCDRQAKNTLDLNYLARAEDGNQLTQPDIRTLAEVDSITRAGDEYIVTYIDHLQPGTDAAGEPKSVKQSLRAPFVFLCAGSVNTTELLLKSDCLWKGAAASVRRPLGTHYFPNADSLAVVFDCDEPHEADYGPTITSALVSRHEADSSDCVAVEFRRAAREARTGPDGPEQLQPPRAGATFSDPGVHAVLACEPMVDWGRWDDPTCEVVGTLLLDDVEDLSGFEPGRTLTLGDHQILVTRPAIRRPHWFLTEDGGYPPDFEPLVGIFRSPLWLRRNRFLEQPVPRWEEAGQSRHPLTKQLRIRSVTDALGSTSRRAGSGGPVERRFAPEVAPPPSPDGSGHPRLRVPALLESEVQAIFPPWFVEAMQRNRQDALEQAAALALPLLGRLLGALSNRVALEIDPQTLGRLGGGAVDQDMIEVLIRGLLRQGLQVLAGSEAAVATEVTRLLFERVPGTPEGLLAAAGDLLLWAIGYGRNDRHTGVLLTMGRDLYRGRLFLNDPGGGSLRASLPTRVVDRVGMSQERLLRTIAMKWKGELRSNPAWTTLGKRVTVHSQGGCPMGDPGAGVLDSTGEVHGCPGLFVMDAAAFPTSVGLNPSATIVAVAEFKIETFLRQWPERCDGVERLRGHAGKRGGASWQSADHADARRWWAARNRADLDPLNVPRPAAGAGQGEPLLSLTFKESLSGFLSKPADGEPSTWTILDTLPPLLRRFTAAEDEGVKAGATIAMTLDVGIPDLSRFVAPSAGASSAKARVSGDVVIAESPGGRTAYVVDKDVSFVQFFVRSAKPTPPTRFFRYHLALVHENERLVLEGVKVLRDSPGFDMWKDTSTVYFEIVHARPPGRPLRWRGVARISADEFLRTQLNSVTVENTEDVSRKSWAFAAFIKYFATELSDVYSKRTEALTEMLWQLLTGVEV